jgi:hypothetical protein
MIDLSKLTADDPDVKHLETMGLVKWEAGKLEITDAGARILREDLLNAG